MVFCFLSDAEKANLKVHPANRKTEVSMGHLGVEQFQGLRCDGVHVLEQGKKTRGRLSSRRCSLNTRKWDAHVAR